MKLQDKKLREKMQRIADGREEPDPAVHRRYVERDRESIPPSGSQAVGVFYDRAVRRTQAANAFTTRRVWGGLGSE